MSITNMKIGKRLGLGFAVILAFLIISTAFGIVRLQGTADATRQMMEVPLAKERMISDWYRLIYAAIRRTTAIAKASDPTLGSYFAAEAAKATKDSAEMVAKMKAMPTSDQERALFDKIAIQQKIYVQARDMVTKAQEGGSLGEADEIFEKKFLPAAQGYEGLVRQLQDYQRNAINEAAKQIDAVAAKSRNMLIVLAVLVVVFGIAFAWWLTVGITRPISKAVTVARRVADGDLTTDLSRDQDVQAKDEVGQLLQALRDMNSNLLRIVGDVRSGTETISAASTQIASGNADLSSRTESQASSLEETASSMEELTSTVKQNADNAKQANQLAATASEVAVKGGSVVSQVVETMGSINDSSKRIVDIISVIDGIAFQTNILALNAAVEAARAGEQGRGFAVVASEVRSLAQRSASAAKEIKELIDDSVSKVDTGSKLVNEAGTTMDEVVASIRRVTDIMGEITAASAEQSAGIEQVNLAITEMDNTTQQNAALVEEAAAAAQSLQDQAAMLLKAVGVFKVSGNALASAAPVPVRAAVAAPKKEVKAARPAVASSPAPRLARQEAERLPAQAVKRREPVAASGDDWEEF
jgi:methyl-accepting chemotaxis protein